MIYLPSYFGNDIQGQNLNLYPVILIGTYIYPTPEGTDDTSSDFGGQTRGDYHLYPNDTYNNNQNPGILPRINGHTTIYSTRAGEVVYSLNNHPVAMKPLLLNMPSINEKMDFENRRYSISNVNLVFSNMEYEGERFSDYAGNLINKEVRILWFSQSTQGWTIYPPVSGSDGDYALHVYKGIIRRQKHDEEKCTLSLEDTSQRDMHRDVPVRRLGGGDDVLEKYRSVPVPMVYGYVEESPLVIQDFDMSGKGTIIADDLDKVAVKIRGDNYWPGVSGVNPLKIFRGETYKYVFKNSPNYQEYGYSDGRQYEHDANSGLITILAPSTQNPIGSGVVASALEDNAAEVLSYSKSENRKLFTSADNSEFPSNNITTYYNYDAINQDDTVLLGRVFDFGANTHNANFYRIEFYYEDFVDDVLKKGRYVEIMAEDENGVEYGTGEYEFNRDESVRSVFKWDFTADVTDINGGDTGYWGYRVLLGYDSTYVGEEFGSLYGGETELDGERPGMQVILAYDNQTGDASFSRSGEAGLVGGDTPKWTSEGIKKVILYELFDYDGWTPTGADPAITCKGKINLTLASLKSAYLISKFRTSKFFASVDGREDTAGTYT